MGGKLADHLPQRPGRPGRRLVLTPHSALHPPESMRDNRGFWSRTAARFLRDGRLENCVNKQFPVVRG